ncbi:hypothetical protein KSP39_PZI022997 [Platanthera zijinensis]|uniref:Uncharacterized protein n=1 Tax=Platanthera zijinensis TaxID=2320716 RepID=A0AAP0AUG7_9ASPA
MEFRRRDYGAEESAFSLPRKAVKEHPLLTIGASPSVQVDSTSHEKVDFEDPLRAHAVDVIDPSSNVERRDTTSRRSSEEVSQLSAKEWAVFSKTLPQKFSCSNMITISTALDIVSGNNRESNKSLADLHLEELEDPEMMVKEEKKAITQHEYVSRLQELKAKIGRAWKADDRINALKLSIKVSRLLIDTSISQFYPTLFLLVIDIMDMFGDLVWERIKKKAEYSEDGTFLCSLSESFLSVHVCSEAKETCYNWFCKIGSIRELVPRIYLELAILRCRRFLEDHQLSSVHRLARMMRGLSDPIASAYCHLYMAYRAAFLDCKDNGYLIMSISNINLSLRRIIFDKEARQNDSHRSNKLIIHLMEPAIEWIMKCIFMDGRQKANDILVEFGFGSSTLDSTWKVPWTSIIIHHLLRQLPSKIVSVHVFEILEFFEKIEDFSLTQLLNYRLLGIKLSESPPHHAYVEAVLSKVMLVVSQYKYLEEYLVVTNAYLDIILQCSMDIFLSSILDGILKRAKDKRANETELDALQPIVMKLLQNFSSIENAFASDHFMALCELLSGVSKNLINLHILEKATRSGAICDPISIQLLFEISKVLHDSIDIINEDYQQKLDLICRFIQMVDFGDDRDYHLTFLAKCRAAFSYFDVIMDILVHLSNNLATGAIKGSSKFSNFVKACVAFSEITIPSIPSQIRCMKLFIATAEVSLFAGLVSHAKGLLNSAIDCLLCLDVSGSHRSITEDEIISLTCKLCNMLTLVPDINGGTALLQRRLMSILDHQPWASPRLKAKVLCAIIHVCARLYQNLLPQPSNCMKIAHNNEMLLYGDDLYEEELSLVTSAALQCLFKAIQQQPASTSRGNLALEACNCLVINFKATDVLHLKCTELIGIAGSCLHSSDPYLNASVKFFNRHFQSSQ